MAAVSGRTGGTRTLTGTEAPPGGQQEDAGGREETPSQSVSQSVSHNTLHQSLLRSTTYQYDDYDNLTQN